MRFTDEGIVIETHPLVENRFLVKIFTKENGSVKGVTPKKVDIGQRVFFDYSSKSSEQLGFIKINQNIVLLFAFSLSPFVASTCHLLTQFLPEHHPYPELYNDVLQLFDQNLERSKGFYIWFEEMLLKHLGFALSLNQCAITEVKDNLVYVSPKTGRALSQSVGAPYHKNLILLPKFMTQKQYLDVEESDFMLALKVTGYFLQKHLGPLPHVRKML